MMRLYSPGMYVTTLHEYFTAEYTLAFMFAGTYSVVVVPELQGAELVSPNAWLPIAMTLGGMMMLDKLVHSKNAEMPRRESDVGMSMVDRL